jgi:hypothetical protein
MDAESLKETHTCQEPNDNVHRPRESGNEGTIKFVLK